MKKRAYYFLVPLSIIVLGVFWYLIHLNQKNFILTIIDSNSTITGDYIIKKDERIIIREGSILTIAGNLTVEGEVVCEEGPLTLVVNGDVLIKNKLECDRGEQLEEEDIGEGISLVAKNSLTITQDAKIITNGHVQIVDNLEGLAKTKEEISSLYEEAGQDAGEGNQLGPFIKKEEAPMSYLEKESKNEFINENEIYPLFNIPTSYAASPLVNISGELVIKTPPKNVKLIVLINLPNVSGFSFKDFWLTGPDARKGQDDKNKSCDAKGEEGQNAMRLFVRAPEVTIDDFTLELGSGGDGGEAETKEDGCEDAKAEGGDGGAAGNFKIIASKNFNISGNFTIYPGRGGSGGGAIAYGKKGEEAGDGGNATAKGGDAKNNEKAVRSLGTINGKSNIFFGSMEGGMGGSALAVPGNGGNGRPCKSEKGGNGGKGTTEGGKGGDALIFLTGSGAKRTDDAKDLGGDGGFVQIIPSKGGNGSTCKPDRPGGNGGKGGDSKAIPGNGGLGATKNGQDGQIHNQAGGDGGNGGDGCTEGKGGLRGNGNPLGKNGKDGKNICPSSPEDKGGATTGGSGFDEVDIEIVPLELTFEHEIGFSPCPQKIGNINIGTKGEGIAFGWKLQTTLPNWLSLPTSGALGIIEANFSCALDQYITQTLNSSLNFQLVDSEGNPVSDPSILNITGYITAE
jgi:hypothetical protein